MAVDNPRLAMHERITEIRKASFESSRKGYDKAQVRRYLEAVADWLEGLGLGDADRGELRRELAWVGERTSEILSKAEETASELRQQGESESTKLRSDAEAAAKRLRTEAQAEADRLRTEASTTAEQTVAAAESRAESILEEAARRRQDLQALIGDLLVRRDEIVADGVRLADELGELFSTAVEAEEDEDGDGEPEPTRRFDPAALDDIAGDTYDEDGVRIPLDDDDGPEPIAGDPGETIESDAIPGADGAEDPDTEEQSTRAR